jgi:hypothetical protein
MVNGCEAGAAGGRVGELLAGWHAAKQRRGGGKGATASRPGFMADASPTRPYPRQRQDSKGAAEGDRMIGGGHN